LVALSAQVGTVGTPAATTRLMEAGVIAPGKLGGMKARHKGQAVR
jgi:hypothetical protein